jgi:hypothetical protein
MLKDTERQRTAGPQQHDHHVAIHELVTRWREG